MNSLKRDLATGYQLGTPPPPHTTLCAPAWLLKVSLFLGVFTNKEIIYTIPGPGYMTTSQPIFCQGGRKSASLIRATQPRCTDFPPDWVTTSAVQPIFWDSDMVTSWHPTGATLAEGWSGTLSCNSAQSSIFFSNVWCFFPFVWLDRCWH